MHSSVKLSKRGKTESQESSFRSDEPTITDHPTAENSAADPSVDGPTGLKLLAITLGLCTTLFLVGLDNIILSTAIPRITDEFSSINDIGWYGSAYLLTTCTFQLTFGKLYSLFSIKLVYLISIIIFEVGSAVCGAAPRSTVLILGRAIAGVGCAGILAGTFTIIAVIIPLPKRPAYTGLVGGVYAIASVVGPLLGGAFTDKVTWRWCFYINLPIGAVAFVIMALLFNQPPRPDDRERKTVLEKAMQVDPVGTLALMPAVICLLLALQWGGTKYPWGDPRVIVLIVFFGILSVAFVFIQAKSGKNATLPIKVITQRSVAAACWFSVCTAGADFTMRQYIPIWFQAIKGVSAVESGLMNLALILATAVASILAGVGITQIGYYNPFMIASTLLMAVGSGLLTTWNPDIPTRVWIGYQVLYGLGSGQSMQTPLVVVQTVLPMEEIPLGTALVMFLQTFGGAIFISVAQNIFTNELRAGLARDLPNINATAIVDGGATSIRQPGVLPTDALGPMLQVYSKSLTKSWYVAVGLACASIAGSALVQWKTVKQAGSPAVIVENGNKDERDATDDAMEMEFHQDLSKNSPKRTDIFNQRSDAI
ncbi:Major facilitator superfamily transporter [Colletotrichum higginsianum IMI 349063]|uniref:Major facilitator superfamily transporter n=1 Tax=Colletotrichum higginsianum (strain IMI 349063) TaxID=759273 RepID=A0A1B7XSF5_COLHI|nr:Major facilitator superfamily transporter [Colletotrichum higginsianum IMI 349063]OBR02691.1 Major facilitator superfamily transporter [Colletotrichum higginsianum IMI 349063]